ncbi:MAG: hypothetical protein HYU61_15135 [Brevundimonas diminuta]|nr:hypothetical protein [Brevundimonas diminuta]
MALFAFVTGAGFVGTAMPRRFNALQWAGLALIAAILLLSAGAYLWAWVNGALG